ncbi:hypothetical protein BJY52DRAFT_1306179 [Lactarius psammicola]|nr:hypothetical protein BJY52DRAFT_1306179 [Lactarius psammicola]
MQRATLRPLRRPLCIQRSAYILRPYVSAPASKPTPGPTKPYQHEKAPPPEQSWLTRKLRQSPTAMRVFLKVSGALGYGSSRQVAARRALALYEQLCAGRAEEDREFWAKECHLPPTFQSWFMVTNLHVWMLTTRLRALPAPHAQAHIQGFIDHFFLDVEDRIRQVLQPQSQPPQQLPQTPAPTTTSETAPARPTPFYGATPTPDTPNGTSSAQKRGRAPEALVSKQMKIFREQWAGLGVALDLALAQGSDAALAAAIWRNLLGARGAQGLALALAPTSPVPEFRTRVARLSEAARSREETRDDGSGVHDFGPEERDEYVRFPETMLVLTAYVRAEVARLAAIPDEKVMGTGAALGREVEGVAALRFGKIASAKALLDDLLEDS